eukprot:jgi/Tetstr1/448178/TSEL_035469.t1
MAAALAMRSSACLSSRCLGRRQLARGQPTTRPSILASRAARRKAPLAPRAVAAPQIAEPEVSTSEPSPSPPPSASKRTVAVSEKSLRSTWEHRAWVWGTSALLAKPLLQALLAASHDSADAVTVAVAVAASYFASDFGTGVYHWSVDNYGSGETPIVGGQIAAFQGHHVRPWTITQREFCNNVHQVFQPAMAPAALLALTASDDSVFSNVFFSTFIFFVCMSQQFHAWSHMKKSELPAAIVALQDAGLLISRKAHGAHHRAPFEGNYCIVSGFWNPILDRDGAPDNFFRRLEVVVADATGVEPRCWHEPQYDWLPEEEMP